MDGTTPSGLALATHDRIAIADRFAPPMLRRVGARVASDCRALIAQPWDALRHGQWRRFWLGLVSATAVLVLAAVARTIPGHVFLQRWAIMRGQQAWWLTIQKIPLSLFAPAYLLPYSFAMLQVFIVFGGAQVLIGVRRTLAVGLAAHVLGSFSVRMWVWIGPPAGLTSSFLNLPDAGPSVAALAIVAYLVVRRRVMWLAVVLLAFHLTEWVTITGLAQREHLVGGLTGAALGGASIVLERAKSRLSVKPVAARQTGHDLDRLADHPRRVRP